MKLHFREGDESYFVDGSVTAIRILDSRLELLERLQIQSPVRTQMALAEVKPIRRLDIIQRDIIELKRVNIKLINRINQLEKCASSPR